MKLVVLTLLCFPLCAIGQSETEFSTTRTVDFENIARLDDKAELDDMHVAEVKFGVKTAPATVKVHPNPSSNDLYVTLNGNGKTGKVIVYDILGNILIEGESFQLTGGSNTWSHNVSAWHTGTYVVRVLQDDAVIKSLRFIKN